MWGDGGAYAAWATYLERWSKDLGTPDDGLPTLAQADFAPETWVRLTNRIIDALNARMRLWSTALTTDLGQAATEFAAGRALGQARTGLASLMRLAGHPGLPADLREQLRAVVEQQVTSVQRSLEDSLQRQAAAGGPRAAIEARRRTFRDNPLTAVLGGPPAAAPGTPSVPPAPAADPWAYDPTAPPRRTLAID
jgi:hypothetical protein